MELRKDYVLDQWVIISAGRGKRPHEFKKEEKESVGVCYFCPGNESLTPPEITRVEKDGRWKIRVFPNKFAAVEKAGDPTVKTHNKYYTFTDAWGSHEVIVDTPDHKKNMSNLSVDEIKDVLKLYSGRITELERDPNIKYVSVFKNHGKEAGASIVHSHTQIISLNIIPPHVYDEDHGCRKCEGCPYCEVIENEKKSHRRCFENNTFVAFTPYASRFHYELWIFPKRHFRRMDDMMDEEFADLASVLKQALERLDTINAPYNLLVHYSPKDGNLHFHIEIAPRLATWAGFEFEDNITINSVSPEDAAKFYRGEE